MEPYPDLEMEETETLNDTIRTHSTENTVSNARKGFPHIYSLASSLFREPWKRCAGSVAQ